MSAQAIEARYDPAIAKRVLANNARAMLVTVAVYLVFVAWSTALAFGPEPSEMPLALTILVWTIVAGLVIGYLAFARWGVIRQRTGDSRDGFVTALAVSVTGLRLPFGKELPWRSITSLHVVDISGRATGSNPRWLGAKAGKALIAQVGIGARTLLVVLNDGPGFATSLSKKAYRRRITLFDRVDGSTGGYLTLYLEPLAPRAEVDAALDVLEVASREHGIPFARELQYGRTAVAIPAEARVP